jgi:hypothetical protein
MKSTVIPPTLAAGWELLAVDQLNGGRNEIVPEAAILSARL